MSTYNRDYYLANRERIIARTLKWREENYEKYIEHQKNSNRAAIGRLRAETYEKYGGARCACCGETEMAFLTLDHVNGGGNRHRKEIGGSGSGSGEKIYRWLRDQNYPPGFQVLCWNCNCGRSMNGGICPHKHKRS